MLIKPVLINSKNFKPFGTVISTKNKKSKVINSGFAIKYQNIINLNLFSTKGSPIVNIFKAKPRSFPLLIDKLEMHPLSSQAFIPLERESYICCVGSGRDKPTIKSIKAFLVPKDHGIIYNKKTWHFPLISVKKMNFLVFDRIGKGKNLVEYFFDQKIQLKK